MIMVYYISAQRQLFQIFTQSIDSIDVTSVTLRGNFKYYFADFVRKGGGVPPKSVTPFLPKILSVKGGRGVPPISVTYFLDQKQVFFGQKSPFLALFEEYFSEKSP